MTAADSQVFWVRKGRKWLGYRKVVKPPTSPSSEKPTLLTSQPCVNAAKTAVKHGEANSLDAGTEAVVLNYCFNPGMKDQPKYIDLKDYSYSDAYCEPELWLL
eukprot:s503_g31.t1